MLQITGPENTVPQSLIARQFKISLGTSMSCCKQWLQWIDDSPLFILLLF